MKIIAVLEVDTEKLEDIDSIFEQEMGWVEQSGIHMVEYQKKKEEYEYAAFMLNKHTGLYEQVCKSVNNEVLCRNRINEYIRKGCLNCNYDTKKVEIRKREVYSFVGKWR